MQWKLELVPLPVEDVDRAKAFYAEQVGFTVDHDVSPTEGVRIVQLTPPGSACSILIGSGVVPTEPGCVQGLHLVVEDVDEAREHLTGHGVEVGDTVVFGPGEEGGATVRYIYFDDPDGNSWAVQEFGQAG